MKNILRQFTLIAFSLLLIGWGGTSSDSSLCGVGDLSFNIMGVIGGVFGCSDAKTSDNTSTELPDGIPDNNDKLYAKKTEDKKAKSNKIEIKVTFIELGSVNCIPCRMMVPVMKEIEDKYGDQVKVVFYDIWTPQEKHFAQKYRIRAIPTQVFLDKNGKEYYRHAGFFPFGEVEKILKRGGVQ